MKKIIAILLCMVILCSMSGMLSACGGGKGTFMVGYGRGDITPEGPVPMKGYGNVLNRLAQTVRDPLYATCVAFTTEDGNTVLLYSMDLCSFPGLEFGKVRAALVEQLGIPADNIIGCSTHNHFGPDFDVDEEKNAYIGPYKEKFVQNAIQAGLDAWNDRKPATAYYGSKEVTGLNFVRHYIMDDGSVDAGSGTGTGTARVAHTSDADNELQVVLLRREGDKDVVMVNWQCHPQEYYWEGNGADPVITADMVGSTRDFVEAQLGCDFIYFSGASGNLNSHSLIESENVAKDVADYGVKLGTQVITALSDLTELKAEKFEYLESDVPVKKGKSSITVRAFRIGDMAFAGVPYEIFDTNGMFIKENSPFEHTFILYFCNSSSLYIASEAAYSYGGYEVSISSYPKGTAEELADGFVDLLNQLHGDVTGGENNG